MLGNLVEDLSTDIVFLYCFGFLTNVLSIDNSFSELFKIFNFHENLDGFCGSGFLSITLPFLLVCCKVSFSIRRLSI